MSGPANSSSDPSDSSALHDAGGDVQQAHDTVNRVVALHNARIAAAHRTPGPDSGQIDRWRSDRDAALADLDRLKTATPDEVVQIALIYAARLKELTAR